MGTFKNSEKISTELQRWLNAFPDSEHAYDRERWYNVIIKSIEVGQNIDFGEVKEYLRQTKKWHESYINELLEQKKHDYFLIKDFIDYYDDIKK